MPTWNEIDREIDREVASGASPETVCDRTRQNYLGLLSKKVGRPVIAYYSGFLQQPSHPAQSINDFDMNGFMAVIHNLDHASGLDLILHTPGGNIEATRAIVEYLYSMFGKSIRVCVPHVAFSAGTMIACAADSIVMGKHSSLGPTDPQVQNVPAMGVIEEIKMALEEIKKNPERQLVWQHVFQKYPPAFIANCERAIDGTREMVRGWLCDNMCKGYEKPFQVANNITAKLMNYKQTTDHGHHFMKDKCKEIGLNIVDLEDDQELQELTLSVHHSYVASFARVKTIKFIENSAGSSWVVSPQ